MDGDLVRGLRSRGIDVVTAADAGMIRRKDEEHLSLATVQGRALYSFNVGDYHEIHTEWTATGRVHAGIIIGAAEALLDRGTDSAPVTFDRLVDG